MKFLAVFLVLILLPLSAAAQTPVKCLKPDGTEESCQLRQCRALGIECHEPEWPIPTLPSPNTPPKYTTAGLPPLEYDKPFDGKYSEIRVGAAIMATVCPKTPFPVTLGCAIHNVQRDGLERVVVPATECVVYIADDDILEKAGWTYDILMRHERGHCNGWPGSHPGARMSDDYKLSNNSKLSREAKIELELESLPPPPPQTGILPSSPAPERGQWPSDLLAKKDPSICVIIERSENHEARIPYYCSQ